ncbi:EAL and HDOD domain-containing protein [Marinimicrobium sp. ABcell2]|uniref:EAL and HDOD domain-containing protein n=1 Tax=Marinimicrobium sp. ABcell2 TaxID=3069751 RepID=UPI0027B49502|nr:HDOD domain-containing protein [Marinimicrobium sp. ABcell2]MDQ2075571.1 HDOD domain-containing protein [Marinimicrobium sp. ABcell2]
MSELLPLLARQPIFNRKMQVVAYELLCRTSDVNQAIFDNGDRASSQVILHTFTDLSIANVVGQHQAYINFTRTLLLTPPPFDRSQLVVEVLEGQQIDAEMLDSLKILKDQGYTIALDDFVLGPETELLLPYADIVKLDVLALNERQLQEHIDYLKPKGKILLAEKVETYETLEFCKRVGFDLFQGYFLARPKIIKGRKVAESKQAVLQLLSVLHDPNVSTTQVERLISQDPMLSYKLLKLVNSAAFGLPRTIESLRQAITLLGMNIIKNWVNLLAMANLGDKPLELSVAALTRARMCETIAQAGHKGARCDTFFTVGLLSTLDAFMDVPLESLLTNISLSPEITTALLKHEGDEGVVLNIVAHYERGEWDLIDWNYLEKQQITPDVLSHMYLDALAWVSDTMDNMAISRN